MSSDPASQRRSERSGDDAEFAGSIPGIYERMLVPLIFDEPAQHLAATVAARRPQDLLETAAGTGVLTRALHALLPAAAITATDLNDAMLVQAREKSPSLTEVRWQQADAQFLEFDEGSFDAVVCQFGVMFFPDRQVGYGEARRVLRPGGAFIFNVWDRLARNPFPQTVSEGLIRAAAESPPRFFERTPYGYYDRDLIRSDLSAAGFDAEIEDCHGVNRGTPDDIAVAFCQGTPLRGELDAHPSLDVEQATTAAAEALEQKFGRGVIEAPSRWLQVVALPRG